MVRIATESPHERKLNIRKIASPQLLEIFKDGRPINGTLDDYWNVGKRYDEDVHQIICNLISAILYYSFVYDSIDMEQRFLDGRLTFQKNQLVRKIKGSRWQGHIVGFYSTLLTPEGYAIESETEIGSVQIYPVNAIEAVDVT